MPLFAFSVLVLGPASAAWMSIGFEAAAGLDRTYSEALRPQFHFSARKNWLNDPNGLVYYRGEYHLFFQYNPFGLQWGNMHWGHAVSKDLVHWEELPVAILPDKHGWAFSGSAVIDWHNTSGLGVRGKPPMVIVYTAAGKPFTDCLASSLDNGRTWKKYPANPVLGHAAGENRDPRVFWHEAAKRWVLARYLDGNLFAIYNSPNLKHWAETGRLEIPNCSECPDMFELPVDGRHTNTKWVFMGANGAYLVGAFDGQKFVKEAGPFLLDHGPHFYAAQTWNDVPRSDGRRIQIAWMNYNKTYEGMPFTNQMSFPCELTLRETPNGLRVFRLPVREIQKLHTGRAEKQRWTLEPGRTVETSTAPDLQDTLVTLEPRGASEIAIDVAGVPVRYRVKEHQIRCFERDADLVPANGKISLRLLIDRTSMELFGNGGVLSMTGNVSFASQNKRLKITAIGGNAVVAVETQALNSAWPSDKRPQSGH